MEDLQCSFPIILLKNLINVEYLQRAIQENRVLKKSIKQQPTNTHANVYQCLPFYLFCHFNITSCTLMASVNTQQTIPSIEAHLISHCDKQSIN